MAADDSGSRARDIGKNTIEGDVVPPARGVDNIRLDDPCRELEAREITVQARESMRVVVERR